MGPLNLGIGGGSRAGRRGRCDWAPNADLELPVCVGMRVEKRDAVQIRCFGASVGTDSPQQLICVDGIV